MGGISNLWMTVSYISNNGLVVEGELEMQPGDLQDSILWIIDSFDDTVGFYNRNSLEIHVLNAVGWGDTTYRPQVQRFILTPLQAGDQIELFYPKCGGIDSIVPALASAGDTVSIFGWPFFEDRYLPGPPFDEGEGNFVVLFDCTEGPFGHENCTEIVATELQIRELKFVVPNVSAGTYEVRVGSEFHTSNILSMEVQ